jgi:hypothetical protein
METSGPADAPMDIEGRHEKHIRVTNHGKMRSWIAFSLKFFAVCFVLCDVPGTYSSEQASDEDKRLIFHTLPSTVDPEADQLRLPTSVTQQDASTATSVTPRLISVVEVIKREFIKNLENDRSPRLKGLHQYNEIVTLEELGVTVTASHTKEGQGIPTETEETRRSQAILLALSGRHQSVCSIHPSYPHFTISSSSKAHDKHNPRFFGSPFPWLSFRI